LRHHPLHREVRRLVKSGDLGQVLFAEGEWSLRSAVASASLWRRDPEASGGGIGTGTGVHVIDLLRFVLADEVVAVSAVTDLATSGASVETRLTATLRFAKGTVGVVRCLRPVHEPP